MRNLEDARGHLLQNITKCTTEPLQIAVVGSSGAGKSTLINAIRGVSPRHKDAAPTGSRTTTTKCTKYRHPTSDIFEVWDIPGVGTENFPKETYLEDIDFEKYDFFLICSCTRFTTDDIWLIEEINKNNKQFYMLRTKVDIDMDNAVHDYPDKDESEVLQDLKEHYKKECKESYDLFMVSSRKPDQWELPAFIDKLLLDSRTKKHDLVVKLVQTQSEEAIRQRKDKLASANKLSLAASSAIGLLPLPGVDFLVDRELLISKINDFKTELGVTAKHLSGRDDDDLSPQEISQLDLKIGLDPVTVDTLSLILSDYTVARVTKSVLRIVPILGQLGGAISAFVVMDKMVAELLNMTESDAMKIATYFVGKLKEQLELE